MTGKYGNTPLYLAALSIKKKDTFDVMRYLIAAGADVNVKQVKYEQETPLHAAVRKNHNNRVKLLLEAGANPKLRTSKGETPYDIASRYGHGQQIEGYLTSYGGGPNQDSQNNNSFGKIFVTAAIAGLANSANISADKKAEVMSATVNDIWIKDGKGTQLNDMYKSGASGSTGNPLLDDLMNTKREQQSVSDMYRKEMKKYQATIKQQREKREQKPSLYQQQLNRIAKSNGTNKNKKQVSNTFNQKFRQEAKQSSSYKYKKSQKESRKGNSYRGKNTPNTDQFGVSQYKKNKNSNGLKNIASNGIGGSSKSKASKKKKKCVGRFQSLGDALKGKCGYVYSDYTENVHLDYNDYKVVLRSSAEKGAKNDLRAALRDAAEKKCKSANYDFIVNHDTFEHFDFEWQSKSCKDDGAKGVFKGYKCKGSASFSCASFVGRGM